MVAEIVNFWRRCQLTTSPYVHPDDSSILLRGDGRHVDTDVKDFDAFVKSARFGDFNDHRLHLSLLPIPYGGDIERSDVVILLLNPGFSFTDYYAEYRVPFFRERLEGNLRQSFDDVEFPFLWLDPEFCWHSGFSWWERKLRDVLTIIKDERFGGCYLDALRDMSRRLAHVELVPYHSPAFQSHALIRELPSVAEVKRLVHDVLFPSAKEGSRTLIVTRQAAVWDLSSGVENLVVYKGGLTRGASLGPKTPGGRAILRRYGIVPR